METIKANILKIFSGEYASYYKLASQVVEGLKGGDNPDAPEVRVAYSIFQAINKYATSRSAIERALHHLIDASQTEMKRLHNGYALDSNWVDSSRYEEYVQETKMFWHEIETLSYLVGLDREQIVKLADKINQTVEYKYSE